MRTTMMLVKMTKTSNFSASASCFGLISDLRRLRPTCVYQRRLEGFEEEELVQTVTGNVSPEEGVQVDKNAEVEEPPPEKLEEEVHTEIYYTWTSNRNNWTMALCDGLSHCKLALAFAVLMDLLGGSALLLGVFAPLEIRGRDFGDLLVYTGALFVLMSLAGWVLWYSGNIDGLTSKKELGHIGSAVDRLARNLSRKIRTYRSQL